MPGSDPVSKLSKARVLVVGDAMLDRYIYGRVQRLSPEAPVPVLTTSTEHSPSHTYRAAGERTVSLVVRGHSSATSRLQQAVLARCALRGTRLIRAAPQRLPASKPA